MNNLILLPNGPVWTVLLSFVLYKIVATKTYMLRVKWLVTSKSNPREDGDLTEPFFFIFCSAQHYLCPFNKTTLSKGFNYYTNEILLPASLLQNAAALLIYTVQ